MQRTCALPECSRPRETQKWCLMHYKRWKRHGDPTILKSARFRRILAMPPTDDCIELGTKGPPISKFLGRYRNASHLMWWLAHGVDPGKLWVLHRCDNRRCLNPNHLFLGTVRDNVRDMVEKGRHADCRGARNPNAKLTAADVRAIRRRWPAEGQASLAREFGVWKTAIHKIVHREHWQ
jgi:HNH endonuclease